MQKWEIKNHWVPVDIQTETASNTDATKSVYIVPGWKENFKKGWAEAETLANEGWELVAVAPETAARLIAGAKNDQTTATAYSYTAGYMLAFRRPKV